MTDLETIALARYVRERNENRSCGCVHQKVEVMTFGVWVRCQGLGCPRATYYSNYSLTERAEAVA